MFGILIRSRIRMFRNTVQSATVTQRVIVGLLGIIALLFLVAFSLTCAALITAMQQQEGGGLRGALTPAAAGLVDHVYQYIFFLLLAGSVPIVSSTLFHADDLPLLLTTPVAPRAVVATKLIDGIVANSTQAFILGLPVLVGIAWCAGLSPAGWACWAASTLLLTIIPPLGAALLLLVAVRCFGMRWVRRAIMFVSIALSFGVVLLAVVGANQAARSGALDPIVWRDALHGTIAPVTLRSLEGKNNAENPTGKDWLPSTWAGAIVQEMSGGRSLTPRGTLGLLGLCVLAAALITLCLTLGTYALQSEAFLESSEGAPPKRRVNGGYRPRMPASFVPLYGMIAKDFKYAMRDTIILSQIGTTLILFLVPFVIRAAEGGEIPGLVDMSGYLTLGMIGLIIYMITSVLALTSIGLEGRSAWIPLGAPLTRGTFLRSKWILSFVLSLFLAVVLTLVAWAVYHWPPRFVLVFCAIYTCMCFALTGLGVGLAGLFPRFIYDNPAHRASGWALILGFVLGTGYLMSIGVFGVVAFITTEQGLFRPSQSILAFVIFFLVNSGLTGIIPVLFAERRMRNYVWEN